MPRPESLGRRAIRVVLTTLFLFTLFAGAGQTGALAEPTTDTRSTDWDAPRVPGELLIALAGAETTAVQASLAAAGLSVIEVIPQLDLALVRVDEAAAGPMSQAAEQAALTRATARATALGAQWSEPNFLFELDFIPNDPYYTSHQQGYLSDRLEMPAAWDKTTGRPEIVIAILDTGVNMTHPDLSAGIWTNPGEIPGNGVDDEGNGFIDDIHGWDFAGDDNLPDDDYGHGTHVAGIAGARINNATGIAGMAGNVMLMPVDVFLNGIGSYADLIRAILYATDNGAWVINMSLGATSYSRGEEAAVNYAWDHDVVVVASAGNDYREAVKYPAAHANAIAVAATNSLDEKANFSNWGDFVDIAAPGVAVWSSYFDGYQPLSGTSMAAPHVSGLAALIRSANPTLTAAQVRTQIEQNADDLGSTGWDPYFGHGRINARRALEGVTVIPGPIPPRPQRPNPIWPAGCREVVRNGDFNDGKIAPWQADHVNVAKIAGPEAARTWAAQFPGGPSSHNTMTQAITVPPHLTEATLTFDFRIETTDNGWGTSPQAPWDDSFTVEFRRMDGTLLRSLLRTGNTADTSGDGLAWDAYLYVLDDEDIALLHANQPIVLAFEAQNDNDNQTTTIWVDNVRLCGKRIYLPYVSR